MTDTDLDEPQLRGDRFERKRAARIQAVQTLFEAHFRNVPVERVMKSQLNERDSMPKPPVRMERALYLHLLQNFAARQETIEDTLRANIQEDWTLDSMNGLLVALLEIAITEILIPFVQKPKGVILSEYIAIAHGFFDDKEAAYVNKVLDLIANAVDPS